jgi:hypothetical protein
VVGKRGAAMGRRGDNGGLEGVMGDDVRQGGQSAAGGCGGETADTGG